MKSRLILALVAASTLALGGCATAPLSYRNYSATENLGTQTLQTGVVIRTMPIEIRDSAAPNANGAMGGIGGGAIGYAVGGNAIGAILGLVGGILVGHALTPGEIHGTEVMVRLNTGQLIGVPEIGNPGLSVGEQVAILRGARGRTRAVPLSGERKQIADGH